MKKYLVLAMFIVLAVAFVSPFSVSAKTKAGTKLGSFFYFFDKAFENTSLFFTFNPEKKAKKVLENAEERLAEAEESASEDNQEAVKDAMENYQKNIEVLEKVLIKVPEEAKEAIEKAIEASKERQEEVVKETAELKKEVPEIKPEVEETENDLKEEENEKEAEIKDDKKDEQKNENIITLPNGAVMEMDADGNVIKTIKEAPIKTTFQSAQEVEQNKIREDIQINSIEITPLVASIKKYNDCTEKYCLKFELLNQVKIEWKTNRPTESSVTLFGRNFKSESGYSTYHFVMVDTKTTDEKYFYEIKATEGVATSFTQKSGYFKILSRPYADILEEIKSRINLNQSLSCYDFGFAKEEVAVCLEYKKINQISNSSTETCKGGGSCP